MFTGLIEEIGKIASLDRRESVSLIRIMCTDVLEGIRLGDSVAVDGACLTVVSIGGGYFDAEAMPETLSGTTLKSFSAGRYVNLERALRADGRMGGHIVQGHVDYVGRVLDVKTYDRIAEITIKNSPEHCLYIVKKGSVAVNGISLTVSAVDDNRFSVSVIPHTLHNTTLKGIRSSDEANIECDIIAKYVASFTMRADRNQEYVHETEGDAGKRASFDEKLRESGFM